MEKLGKTIHSHTLGIVLILILHKMRSQPVESFGGFQLWKEESLYRPNSEIRATNCRTTITSFFAKQSWISRDVCVIALLCCSIWALSVYISGTCPLTTSLKHFMTLRYNSLLIVCPHGTNSRWMAPFQSGNSPFGTFGDYWKLVLNSIPSYDNN